MFIKPLYDSYCFSNIPQTIKNVLLNERHKALPADILGDLPTSYDKVIVLLLDGFGWKFFNQHLPHSTFLQHIMNHGIISKLTTQFPSTTPAEITTINTGLPVGRHGVYEWLYYEPQLDEIIAPLLFSFAGTRIRDTLIPTGIDPQKLFPQQTVYNELKQNGVVSYAYIPREFAYSPYGDVVLSGANIVPYTTFPEALSHLSEMAINQKAKSYFYLYFGNIDRMGHLYGPDSQQFNTEATATLHSLENIFLKHVQGKLSKTLFIITADHGQAAIDPLKTIYLNKEFPQIKQWIKMNKEGSLIVPAGSCRDMFLHIKDEFIDEAVGHLQGFLEDKAEVYKVNDLVNKQIFGPDISQTFLSRVGNVVILCRNNESVWWYEKDKFEITYHGHHGGMTNDEMEIPFACLPFL